ncbi:MAG: glycosyltransferase [Lachnospiraceae bacterium]|nr:glycosyltransferase [Lachnospiraceae bacterium]
MEEGKVSVITPCYNGEKYVGETIQSVLSQTYPNWEMLIVDDGSTDASRRVLEAYAAKDERIRCFYQENRGSAAARNLGLREASGRYIALLDADDLWDPDFLEKQLAFMKEKRAVCVASAYRFIDSSSRDTGKRAAVLKEITKKDMLWMNRVGCLTGLYDSSCFGKLYLNEELRSVRDDYAYWYKITEMAEVIYGNQQVLASYRVLAGSTTGNKRKLIGKQYRFYRDYLHLGRLRSCVNILYWGLSGVLKFPSGRK